MISSWGGNRHKPYAFTEQGVAMLSSILHSDKAIKINIAIMRAFVAVRQMLYNSNNVSKEINELKQRVIAIEKGNEDTLQSMKDLNEETLQAVND